MENLAYLAHERAPKCGWHRHADWNSRSRCVVKQPRQKSVQEIWAGATELQRQIIAEGIATMHRFSPEPTFKYGKPVYKNSNTVEAIAHAKEKAKRKSRPSAQ